MKNISNKSATCLQSYTTSIQITLITVESLITFFSFAGNILVVVAVSRKKKLRTKVNLFITSMAVSDLLVPVCYLPSRINTLVNRDPSSWVSGPFGEFSCKFVPYIVEVSIAVSILTMITIAVERLYHVLCPFRALQVKDKVRRRTIAVIWAFSFAIQGYHFDFRGLNSEGKCVKLWAPGRFKTAITLILVSQIAIPFMLLVVFSSVTIFILLRNKMKNFLPYQEISRRGKRNKRISFMLIIVTTVYLAAWMPFVVYNIRSLYGDKEKDCAVDAAMVAVVFSYTAINPVIYFVFLKSFRKELKEMLCPTFKDSRKPKQNHKPLISTAPPLVYKESSV